jgi:hypothetical protein
MASLLDTALHDGSGWFILVCLIMLVGVAAGLYTRRGSGISSHPYEQPTDMPPEATGREELETILSPRRSGRRARRAEKLRAASTLRDAQ